MTQFNDRLVQGYYLDESNALHIHFYGSNQTEDWIADFLAAKWGDRHLGFLIYAGRAMGMIRPLLNGQAIIRLTGHSLGGAIAVLVGSKLERMGHRVIIETAGAPRAGGLWWWIISGRGLAHTRYQVKGDLVPTIPPWWMGWKHSGRIEWIDRPDIKSLIDKHQPVGYQGNIPFSLD